VGYNHGHTGEEKDNVKARVDIEMLCDRPKQVIPKPIPGKKWKRPKVDFVLSREQRKEVLEWIQNLMFPDGYAANLRRGVNLTNLKLKGLKSHDYHIWIERLLPMMVRGYVPEHVWQVLADLRYFFRQLCAKELSHVVIDKLEQIAHVLLCKLEMIFPPGFFNPMEHMIFHLLREARLGGACRTIGAIQLRVFARLFETHVKIKIKLKLALQRHKFCKRFQTSQLNTMRSTFPACITALLDTILEKMNRTSAFSEDNLEVQVFGRERPYLLKSGALSRYIFCATLRKYDHT
jgi:hypothetical protein